MTFLNAKYQSGFELISELLDLENHIKLNSYDLIITGEGRIDGQTRKGKILMHLGNMGKETSIPVIAFGGTVDDNLKELKLKWITELVQISSPNESIEEEIRKTEFNLKKAIRNKIQKYLN